MNKVKLLVTLFLVLSIGFWSCQSEENPISSPLEDQPTQSLGKFTGKAYLYVDYLDVSNNQINIHMLTEDWKEDKVSWKYRDLGVEWSDPNGGGVYNEQHIISIITSKTGLMEIDITKFVDLWTSGHDNFGIIFMPDDTSFETYNRICSKDNPFDVDIKPYVVIKYDDGREETVRISDDSFIREKPLQVADNFNSKGDVRMSFLNDYEIRGLLKFDLPKDLFEDDVKNGNCTKTVSYWKTHAKGKKKDPTWDLLPNGTKTKFFKSKKSYHNIISRISWGNPYYVLASQYAAAELNIIGGVSEESIQDDFQKATELLSDIKPNDFKKWWKVDKDRRQMIYDLTKVLKDFNFGELEGGPVHCDDYKYKKKDKEWKKWWKDKWGKWKKDKDHDDNDDDNDDDDDNP